MYRNPGWSRASGASAPVCWLFVLALTAAPLCAQELGRQHQAELIDDISQGLREIYVFPEVAAICRIEEMKRRDMLSDKWKAGDIVQAFAELKDELPKGRFGEELESMQGRFGRAADMLRTGATADEVLAEMDAGNLDESAAA